MPTEGQDLIRELKEHVLKTMAKMPECAPKGEGCPGGEIEKQAHLEVDLDKQTGWINWTALELLKKDNKVESFKRGRFNYWRLI